jgi:hypothetical protein
LLLLCRARRFDLAVLEKTRDGVWDVSQTVSLKGDELDVIEEVVNRFLSFVELR